MELGILIGIVALLILLFNFLTYVIGGKEAQKEHVFLRLFLVFVFLNLLVLIAKSSLDNNNFCDVVVNNETVTGNTTAFTYRYECLENTNTTANTFYWAILWVNRLFWIYIIVYASYKAFFHKKMEEILKRRRGKKLNGEK